MRFIFAGNVWQMGELTLPRGGNGGRIIPPVVEGGCGPIVGDEREDTILNGGELCDGFSVCVWVSETGTGMVLSRYLLMFCQGDKKNIVGVLEANVQDPSVEVEISFGNALDRVCGSDLL